MNHIQADIMVISAHPDDSEFGAAGSVARWTSRYKTVIYVVCTSGDKGTSDRGLTPEKLVEIREREQLAAAGVLGVKQVVFLKQRDQELEDTPDFRKEIVKQIRIFRPRTVVTSDPYRRYIWHRDHRIVGQVTLDAIFPYARDYLAYPDFIEQGLEPHKVSEILFFASEEFNLRIDITDTFDIKMKALRCHKSQIRESGAGDLETWVRKQCRDMAKGESFELAEAFYRVEVPG